jgi:sphingomyelin phosphodiesterase acid-like 3
MPHLSRRTFLELTGATLICGCGGSSSIGGNGDAEVLVFSDVHFNPFYDQQLFQRLDESDPSQWEGIFESSTVTAPSIPGADTNYPLFKIALASIRANLGSSQVVVYSGDLLGHQIANLYQSNSGSSDATAMQTFTDKTATFVMQQIRSAVGDIPVVFAVGNCDSYTGYGPNSVFLNNTAEIFYSLMLNGTANHDEFLDTFKTAGYYSVELFGERLMVIALNTVLCSTMVPGDNSELVNPQLLWLDAKLASAKAAGQKVWLVMHVPLGAFVSQTAGTIDANGQISTSAMMWNTDYQNEFLTILSKYPGVLSMCIGGHTHMDEYRIMSPDYVLGIAPGISPVFGNDPAYKVFTIDQASFVPNNYRTMSIDLHTLPKRFRTYYLFTTAYSVPAYTNQALSTLFLNLATDKTKQSLFRQYYYSGNDSSNPISNLNWPVYWSAIGNVSQQAFLTAVNTYR